MPSTKAPRKRPSMRQRVSRARKKTSLLTALWMLVSVVSIIVAFVLQGVVWFIVAVLFSLVAVLSAFGDFAGPEGVAGAVPVKSTKSRKGPSSRKSGQILPPCTKTGTAIDRCKCSKRHVASQEGADRYKKRVGDPLGKAAQP